jgi:hypothetical protein
VEWARPAATAQRRGRRRGRTRELRTGLGRRLRIGIKEEGSYSMASRKKSALGTVMAAASRSRGGQMVMGGQLLGGWEQQWG